MPKVVNLEDAVRAANALAEENGWRCRLEIDKSPRCSECGRRLDPDPQEAVAQGERFWADNFPGFSAARRLKRFSGLAIDKPNQKE
jgi:hypothetical protein